MHPNDILRTVPVALALAASGCLSDASSIEVSDEGLEGPGEWSGERGRSDHADSFALPGESFYPEGIAAAADGTLYVGSVGTGAIVRRRPGDARAMPFIASHPSRPSIVGMIVDDAARVLWACTVDTASGQPSTLRSFDLRTGTERSSFVLGEGGFCNDVTMDGDGNLYVTDSAVGLIYRLAPRAAALEVWSNEAAYAPTAPGEFTVNGIDWDGGSNLYTVKNHTGQLFRIPIAADGKAGAAVLIAVGPPLQAGDGLKAIDADTLIVVEGTGSLRQVNLVGDTATTTTLGNRLDLPTTFAIAGDSAWVVEGQLERLFGLDPSKTLIPFLVRRIGLD